MLKEIEELTAQAFKNQLAFCYLTCERLLPNYGYFCRLYNWGDLKLMQQATGFIRYNLLQAEPFDITKIKSLISLVDENTPDTEDFNDVSVSSALDACTAVLETLEFMIDADPKRIIYVSTFA